jgi:hypothetical protein
MSNFSAVGKTSYIQWDNNDVHFVLDQLNWIFIVLTHWNNSLWADILLQWLIQSMLLSILKAVFLAEKQ